MNRKGQGPLDSAAAILRTAGHDLVLAPTPGPGAAAALAREWVERGAGLILACGGDGTINEVAEGMVHSSVPLGILPAGTANVLAHEIGLGRTAPKAAAQLAACVPRRISLGRVWTGGDARSRHFLCMAGAGLDARMVYNVSGPLKDKTGKLAYVAAAIALAGARLAEFEAVVDGRCYTCSFALIAKVRNYAGDFAIARSVTLFDDTFEVVLFQGRLAAGYLRYLIGVVALKQNARMPGVTTLRAREVALRAPSDSRVHVQVDGEYAGRLPARIEVVPDALTLLVP